MLASGLSSQIGRYRYLEDDIIGRGSSGKVYLGVDTSTNQKVAVKVVDMKTVDNQVTQYLLQSEKQALLNVKSPYVINAIEVIQNSHFCYLITEYYSGGTLKERIQDHKNKNPNSPAFTEIQSVQILQKLAQGLKAICQKGFIHRDLKTANVMFRGKDPVIIDFGYCENTKGKKPNMYYNVGSPSYMAPEAFRQCKYSEKSDVWALGVIYHEMLMGMTLDYGVQIKEFFSMVQARGLGFSNIISPASQQLLSFFLKVNPSERIGVGNLSIPIRAALQNLSGRSVQNRQMPNKASSQMSVRFSHTEPGFKKGGLQLSSPLDHYQLRLMDPNIRQVVNRKTGATMLEYPYPQRRITFQTPKNIVPLQSHNNFLESYKGNDSIIFNLGGLPPNQQSNKSEVFCQEDIRLDNSKRFANFPNQSNIANTQNQPIQQQRKIERLSMGVQSLDSSFFQDDIVCQPRRMLQRGQLQKSKPEINVRFNHGPQQTKGSLFYSDVLSIQSTQQVNPQNKQQFRPWQFNKTSKNRVVTHPTVTSLQFVKRETPKNFQNQFFPQDIKNEAFHIKTNNQNVSFSTPQHHYYGPPPQANRIVQQDPNMIYKQPKTNQMAISRKLRQIQLCQNFEFNSRGNNTTMNRNRVTFNTGFLNQSSPGKITKKYRVIQARQPQGGHIIRI